MRIKSLIAALTALVFSVPAYAGSTPNWAFGYIPTPAEWNTWWGKKLDDPGCSGYAQFNGTGAPTCLAAIPTSGLSGTITAAQLSAGAAAANLGLGANVGTALQASLNATGGLVGYSGALGTPTQGVLTNATGLPILTGVSGLGANVATALAASLNATGGVPSVPVAAAQMASGAALANIAATVAPQTGTNFQFTASITSGVNTFTVDAPTQTLIQNAILANGGSFNGGTGDYTGLLSIQQQSPAGAFPSLNGFAPYVSKINGTTVTVSRIDIGALNASATESVTLTFGGNRVYSPFITGTRVTGGQQGLFGSAASAWNTGGNALVTGNTTWQWPYLGAADFYRQGVISLNDDGHTAGYFASHTAPLGSVSPSTYGVFFNAINDGTAFANNIWAIYAQCEQAPGANQAQTFCAELSPVNYGVAGTAVDPYTVNTGKNVETMRLDAGNGWSGLSNGSDIIHMMGNGAKVLHGIDFDIGLFDFTSDATAPALALPANASVQWYSGASAKSWGIFVGGNTTTSPNYLQFNGTQLVSSAPVNVPLGAANAPAVQVGSTSLGLFNGSGFLGISVGSTQVAAFSANNLNINSVGLITHERNVSCSGGTITVLATDYSVETSAYGAAGCSITLPTVNAGERITISDGAGTAATHNITITPASGTIDGAATYTGCNTNYCSWTGEWNGTIWKSVAKF